MDTLGDIALDTSFFQQRVQLGISIVAKVLLSARVKQCIGEVLGIRVSEDK
jgi:hypothetical protein